MQQLMENFNHTYTDSCIVIGCTGVRSRRKIKFYLYSHHSSNCEHNILFCLCLYMYYLSR